MHAGSSRGGLNIDGSQPRPEQAIIPCAKSRTTFSDSEASRLEEPPSRRHNPVAHPTSIRPEGNLHRTRSKYPRQTKKAMNTA
jgi:hypothetical protein